MFAGRSWVLVRDWPHRSGLCPSQDAPLATPRDSTREPLVGKVAPASLSMAPSYPLAFALQVALGSPRQDPCIHQASAVRPCLLSREWNLGANTQGQGWTCF